MTVTVLTETCLCSSPQYVTENEGTLQQVKAMLASTQKDKLELANQLEEEKRYVLLLSRYINTSMCVGSFDSDLMTHVHCDV